MTHDTKSCLGCAIRETIDQWHLRQGFPEDELDLVHSVSQLGDVAGELISYAPQEEVISLLKAMMDSLRERLPSGNEHEARVQ